MTNVVDFKDMLKQVKENNNKQVFRLTDSILEGCNRIHDAKLTGALQEDELSKELIAEGKLFSNQVKKGLKTEEEVEDFEKEIPDGKNNYFEYPHKDLDVAKSTITQTNNVALLSLESLNKRSQMPESYTKGLRRAS